MPSRSYNKPVSLSLGPCDRSQRTNDEFSARRPRRLTRSRACLSPPPTDEPPPATRGSSVRKPARPRSWLPQRDRGPRRRQRRWHNGAGQTRNPRRPAPARRQSHQAKHRVRSPEFAGKRSGRTGGLEGGCRRLAVGFRMNQEKDLIHCRER